MNENALIIFVKNLISGHVKTRLAAALGDETAMEIYNQLLVSVKQNIHNINAEKIVFYSTFIEKDIWENNLFQKEIQQGSDLGERMKNAFKKSFSKGYKKILIIGTDCPDVDENILESAYENLNQSDVVIGPAIDGGYYLLGMKKENSVLFDDVKWSTDQVLNQTINHCKNNNLTYFLLPELSDIDEEKDLIYFKNLSLSKLKSS